MGIAANTSSQSRIRHDGHDGTLPLHVVVVAFNSSPSYVHYLLLVPWCVVLYGYDDDPVVGNLSIMETDNHPRKQPTKQKRDQKLDGSKKISVA